MSYRTVPLKRLLTRNDGGVWGEDSDGTEDTMVLRSTEQTKDGHWRVESPAFRKLTPAESSRYRLMVGDLLVTKSSGSSSHIGKTTIVNEGVASLHACYSNFMQRLRLNEASDARFYWYNLRSDFVRSQLGLFSTTTTGLANLTGTTLAELRVSVPSLLEQKQIADFLDRETQRIDNLIAEQEALVENLTERRKANIELAIEKCAALTVGAKFKHHVTSVAQGWSPQCMGFAADGISEWGVLKTGCVNHGVFRASENKALPEQMDAKPTTVVRRQHLVMSRASTRELVGSAAIVNGDFPRLMLSDKLYAFTVDSNRALPEYITFSLGTRRYRSLIELEATGASPSMQNISLFDILNLPLNLPSVEEQRKIVSYLDDRTAKTDALITEAKALIDLLNERRSALISAAVTGKIDVRSEVLARG